MPLADIIRLSQVVVWPAVTLVLAIIYRKDISTLFRTVGGKISKFTAIGMTLELAAAKPAAESLGAKLDQIREPSSTEFSPRSGVESLIELADSSPVADYIVIDLRAGEAWLTSRLYLFAVVLPRLMPLQCFVFVGDRGQVPRCFLGCASPECVIRKLGTRFPWLRKAMVESQFKPVVEVPDRPDSGQWWPETEELRLALTQLTVGPAVKSGSRLDFPRARALETIIRGLVIPVDLLQPKGVEELAERFVRSPSIRRPHDSQRFEDRDWVKFNSAEEHAQWIRDERKLVDLLGNNLSREQIVTDRAADKDSLVKAVLRRKGTFVALTDAEGRFDRLVDRAALLERVAAGVEP
jgi:hypothetical protein